MDVPQPPNSNDGLPNIPPDMPEDGGTHWQPGDGEDAGMWVPSDLSGYEKAREAQRRAVSHFPEMAKARPPVIPPAPTASAGKPIEVSADIGGATPSVNGPTRPLAEDDSAAKISDALGEATDAIKELSESIRGESAAKSAEESKKTGYQSAREKQRDATASKFIASAGGKSTASAVTPLQDVASRSVQQGDKPLDIGSDRTPEKQQEAKPPVPSAGKKPEVSATESRPSLFDDDQKRVMASKGYEDHDATMKKRGYEKDKKTGRWGKLDDAEVVDPQQEWNERQWKMNQRSAGLFKGAQVASAAANHVQSPMGAGAGLSTIASGLSGAGAGVSAGFGPAGIAMAASAYAVVGAFDAVTKSAEAAAKNLGQYNAKMSFANAQANIRQIKGDVARAGVIGDNVARYTDSTSRLSEFAQNAQAAFLKAALDQIVPILEKIADGIDEYGPMVLDGVISILETLNAALSTIPDILNVNVSIAKGIAKSSLDAAKNLKELNDRDRDKDMKNIDFFTDEFFATGGMGVDPPWNPAPNRHPNDPKFDSVLGQLARMGAQIATQQGAF